MVFRIVRNGSLCGGVMRQMEASVRTYLWGCIGCNRVYKYWLLARGSVPVREMKTGYRVNVEK